MSVDLPSSTEPAVASRSEVTAALEVAGNLAVLHGGLADAVVGARLAALGDPRERDLGDDLVERRGAGLDRARATHVTDRPVAHAGQERVLVRQALDVVGHRVEHPVAAEDL